MARTYKKTWQVEEVDDEKGVLTLRWRKDARRRCLYSGTCEAVEVEDDFLLLTTRSSYDGQARQVRYFINDLERVE
jgi:hypothetical protein